MNRTVTACTMPASCRHARSFRSLTTSSSGPPIGRNHDGLPLTVRWGATSRVVAVTCGSGVLVTRMTTPGTHAGRPMAAGFTHAAR